MPIDLTNASTNIPDTLYYLSSSAIYGNKYTMVLCQDLAQVKMRNLSSS